MNDSPKDLSASEPLENSRILGREPLVTPRVLHTHVPVKPAAADTVRKGRSAIEAILTGKDPRMLAIVGPCSVHDAKAAMDFARRLVGLQAEVADTLLLVMRVYFEKPRTTTGWKGFINDPHMDDSFDIATGLCRARQLLVSINELGIPVGTEALDPLTPQYLGDLVSWAAIGARTAESQTHREMASGLSCPVGFKNGTDGSVATAVNGIVSAQGPHAFLGSDFDGEIAIMHTAGNPFGHLVLRGGPRPNYDSVSVAQASAALQKSGCLPAIVVDCSHGNSQKDFLKQPLVLLDVVHQRCRGTTTLKGFMLESNLLEGRQEPAPQGQGLVYGQSVTDACLSWARTAAILKECSGLLRSAA